MNQQYHIRDWRGERVLGAAALPLRIGGAEPADIILPGLAADCLAAVIARSGQHAFVQPLDDAIAVYHNHQRLDQSAWLKSGDCVQAGDGQLSWMVQGDLVFIEVGERFAAPPVQPVAAPQPPLALPDAAGQPRSLWARLAGVSAFLCMAAAAAFISLAGTVQVQVTPADASTALSGWLPALRLGQRYLALPGAYRLHAERAGYRPWQTTLNLARGDNPIFTPTLEALPGQLRVHTKPPSDFTLWVDGAQQTPDAAGEFALARGSHALRIVSTRYLPEQLQIEIEGLGSRQELSVTLRPAWAQMRLSSTPDGAQVHIDDERVGLTPLSVEVMQGTRTFTFSLDGYKTAVQVRDIRAGERLETAVTLVLADGLLNVLSTPAGATLMLDGVFQGTTPLRLALLPESTHELHLSKSGFQSLKQQIRLEPGERRELSLTLHPSHGTVFLSTTPADAELLIDGQPAGIATRRLRLRTMPHRLEVRKPGYVSKTLTVTPRADSSQTLQVKLLDQAQQRAQTLLAAAPRVQRDDGQNLLLIRPEGAFEMGASRREAGRRANEGLRRVRLRRAFYLGDKEVNNAQYRLFRPAHHSGVAEGSDLDTGQQPVVNISWEDAVRYCNWLSRQDGLPEAYLEQDGKLILQRPVGNGYRLPTEAEWVYVARLYGAVAPRKYAWDGSFPPQRSAGNFADARIADRLAEALPGYDDSYRVSAPVGHFADAAAGFYDLGGNVAEWIHDYYAQRPLSDAQSADPMGPETGQHHVIKGASWRHGSIAALRLSYRDYGRQPRDDLGFRIARYLE